MSGTVNRVILVANLGKDPEIRTMQSGGRVCNLSVATSESWTDKQSGERREKTEWHRVVIFDDQLCEVAEKYLAKGRKVYIEGQLQTRKWQDQSGQDRYSTEVVLQKFRGVLQILDRGDQRQGDAGAGAAQEKPGGNYATAGRRADAPAASGKGGDLDDEIPFAPAWQG